MRSQTLGERESGTARLEEAVAAYREALQEYTRARVPLQWATTQMNLGNALSSARRAGERDGAAGGGRRRLSRSLAGVRTNPRSPYYWQMAQGNLDNALALLANKARAGASGEAQSDSASPAK